MNLTGLATVVQFAIEKEPPDEIVQYCTELYYRPYYYLLHLLALHFDGPCVELGVEKGRGVNAMALAGAQVYGVDNNVRPEALELACTWSNLQVTEVSSLPVPNVVGNLQEPIKVLHIDTEHSFAQAREEFWAYKPLLANPAVVCFDDTHAQESDVGRFVSSLPWSQIHDDRLHECGYAVMLYDGDRP